MTRPRHEVIDLTESSEELFDSLSRRRLMQLAGATGASFTAGCGGGGGEEEETPEETPTGGGGGETATKTDTDTPTSAASDVEVTDVVARDLTTRDLSKWHPNDWNPETGWRSEWIQFGMATIPESKMLPSSMEGLTGEVPAIVPGAAHTILYDPQNTELTFELVDDLTWSSGHQFDAENLFMQWDLREAMITIGEMGESGFAASREMVDDYEVTAKLLPGSPGIRLSQASGGAVLAENIQTHPEHHRQYVENIRDATTQQAIRNAFTELWEARFPQERVKDLAIGPFVPTDWNQQRMNLEAREDFPWGMDQRTVDRIFQGVRITATNDEQVVNATISGKNDQYALNFRDAFDRFPDSWDIWDFTEATGATTYFVPTWFVGKKNGEVSGNVNPRLIRKGITCLFNPEETAAIQQRRASFEPSAGFYRKSDFKQWLGDIEDQLEHYGRRDTGYDTPELREKGRRLLREGGLEQNKNGNWIRADTGDPLTPTVIMSMSVEGGITRPILNNVPEQLNQMGIQASGKILEQEQFENAVAYEDGFEGEMFFMTAQCETHPHPYGGCCGGFLKDCGIGGPQLNPDLDIGFWDWQNGYRRVKVPMPIGDPDGDLQVVDWDKTIRQMPNTRNEDDVDDLLDTLAWTLNQWVPGIMTLARLHYPIMNRDRFEPHDDWTPDLVPSQRVHLGWLTGSGLIGPA